MGLSYCTMACKRCAKHGRRFCLICLGAVVGLPLEHFVWEHVPGALWLLRQLGVTI